MDYYFLQPFSRASLMEQNCLQTKIRLTGLHAGIAALASLFGTQTRSSLQNSPVFQLLCGGKCETTGQKSSGSGLLSLEGLPERGAGCLRRPRSSEIHRLIPAVTTVKMSHVCLLIALYLFPTLSIRQEGHPTFRGSVSEAGAECAGRRRHRAGGAGRLSLGQTAARAAARAVACA